MAWNGFSNRNATTKLPVAIQVHCPHGYGYVIFVFILPLQSLMICSNWDGVTVKMIPFIDVCDLVARLSIGA